MFYPNGSPEPTVRPPYIIIVDSGAYGYSRMEDCVEAARQLRSNGISFRMCRI